MSDPEENNLTEEETGGIILSEDETRIVTNLRRYAEMYPHSELAVLFQVHNAELKYGTLCLGVAPNASTIRL